MITEGKRYTVSPIEMRRRKNAYTTLICTLFSGIALPTFYFFDTHLPILIGTLAGSAVVLVASRQLLFRSFHDFSKIILVLTDTHIARIGVKSSKQYQLSMIAGLWIKRTVNKSVREIKIRFNDKKQLSITALQDFEDFEKTLREKIPEHTAITAFQEPID